MGLGFGSKLRKRGSYGGLYRTVLWGDRRGGYHEFRLQLILSCGTRAEGQCTELWG